MLRTKTWLDSHGSFPLHVEMSIGNEVIRTNSSVKYLSIGLDTRLTFMYYIQYMASKAQKIVGQLSRLMANIRGPLPARPRLCSEVANNVMLYGSEEVGVVYYVVYRLIRLKILGSYPRSVIKN